MTTHKPTIVLDHRKLVIGIKVYDMNFIRRQFRDHGHVDLHAYINTDMEMYEIITLCLIMA